jgi:hypothetical protein
MRRQVEAGESIARVRVPSLALLGFVLLLAGAGRAGAETPAAAQEERPTGLPKAASWTFNLDAGLGWFGFGNSLYTNARPDPSGNLGANWGESFVKPALSASLGLGGSELYGKLSAVGERTFSAPPPLVGSDESSFLFEDLYVGWRSGKSLGKSENLLDFTVGRAPYKIGHGMLLWDGAGEGGSRGGFWSNARKAWAFATVARVKPGNHTIDAFYLARDDVPEAETGSSTWGANYELALGERSTIGAAYMKWSADRSELARRDGLSVYNLRAYTAPFRAAPGLAFELEYSRERNGDANDSSAWTAQAGYEFGSAGWKPRLSYRYAYFEGDDPATPADESFDPLYPGFYDWGSWWQGEIAGEYFIANSNLVSHQLRLHVAPNDSIGAGVIAYLFGFDQLPSAEATSKDLASELDAYCDWKVNKNFTLSFVTAYASPKEGVRQAYGRTDNFKYGMVYVAYSY